MSILSVVEVNRDLPRPQYAYEVNRNLIVAKKQSDLLFLIIGKLLKEIRDNRLYEELDYLTFTEFLYSNDVSFSKESAFMYIRVFEYYIEELGMSEEQVGKMNVSRLSLLLPLLKKVEDKTQAISLVEEYSQLIHSDFMLRVRQIKQNDKPRVYYSKQLEKWMVEYYEDRSQLHCLGNFPEEQAMG